MKLTSDGLMTSTELMEELFAMNEKMIHNLSEKRRYEVIYEHLTSQRGAKVLDKQENNYGDHTVLGCEGEIYLIPDEIFDESDEKWLELIDTEEEEEIESEAAQVVSV